MPLLSQVRINREHVVFAVLLLAAFVTRFYDLESRVMSHDETSHVYFSWVFQQGNGYSHDPVTHGPLQFHLVALSYFLLGDSDFSARVPAALFSVATIAFMWYFRRYLGRAGALIAAGLYLISPYMLYYGRYVRNEAFVGLWGVISLWAILRYLETGRKSYILWLTAVMALHFTTKETSFIYAAQALMFLAIVLIGRVLERPWPKPEFKRLFLIALMAALLLGSAGFAARTLQDRLPGPDAAETALPVVPGAEGEDQAAPAPSSTLPNLLFAAAGLGLGLAAALAAIGYTWQGLRNERAFDLAIALGTMTLPMLAPFPVRLLGMNPIDYQSTQVIWTDVILVVLLSGLAIGIGVAWNWRTWLANAALFYGIFVVFYTSLFTNGFGFITGLVGSLGYWLEQQGVNRGSQPWYFYAFVQVPIYEFLPALGSLGALLYYLLGGSRARRATPLNDDFPDETAGAAEHTSGEQPADPPSQPEPETTRLHPLALFGFWSITSLLAYTIAGEKMPWLTVHITLPMILCAAWLLGRLVDSTDWRAFLVRRGALTVVLLPVFFISLLASIGSLLGTNPPFQGSELTQLRATSTFITAVITAIASGWGLVRLTSDWETGQVYRVLTLMFFGLLGVLTARAAFRAAYINYDNATEYLVYAHMSPGPKLALEQLEEISRRTTNGLAIRVGYDNETTYPYWWYLRNFTNKDYFDKNPTRAQREDVAILVGDANYDKIEPVVGQAYQAFEYIRIWWPNQDYFNMTRERLVQAVTDPQMRTAIFKVWLDRDFSLYSQVTEQDLSLENWTPSHKFRLYIRKDVIASLWNYGVAPSAEELVADPYEGKGISLPADLQVGSLGDQPGQFRRPRGIALAADGSVYVADTENHRIQHLDADGQVLQTWGSFAASAEGAPAPNGSFNEPWGVAVGPDGAVYVADTWNHRIQKFTPEGQFITTWGYGISQTGDPFGFYGPRAVAVDGEGRVYVTDTGNKRIVVFDSQGNFITQFGQAGLLPGDFDEPVGVAVDAAGLVYVADTWNQRIQVFLPGPDNTYSPYLQWDVVGWYGQSLDNKPYLAADQQGNIFAVDPEGYRVLQFTSQGQFVRYWGDYGAEPDGLDIPGAVAAGPSGVWVTDVNNNRVLHFTLP